MTEDWTKWEGLVIDGAFPLRRFLGRSSHSVVFLSEHRAHDLPDAAIKLIPADPVLAEAQLSRWRIAAALSHPHLIRIFESGRCRLGGHPFLFVVMEYAEQTLAQLLPHRPLTADEVREMLRPTLDALAYLHGKNLVQGELKPPNVLVVNDQVKLATDNVRPGGDSSTGIAEPSAYDSPESMNGKISAAGDIWGLGVTLTEALTQYPPTWSDARRETTASLPPALPSAFVDIVRRCLSRYPAARPTIADLDAYIRRTSPAPVAVPAQIRVPDPPAVENSAVKELVSKAAASEAAPRAAAANTTAVSSAAVSTAAVSAASPSTTAASAAAASTAAASTASMSNAAVSTTPVGGAAIKSAAVASLAAVRAAVAIVAETGTAVARKAAASIPTSIPTSAVARTQAVLRRQPTRVLAAAAVAGLAVIWLGWRLLHGHPAPAQPASTHAQAASQPALPPAAVVQGAGSPTSVDSAVLHREIPDVPRHARESIRGRIKVTVRVSVDRSGSVVAARLVIPGSSRYFARQAMDSAMKWKFVPADKQSSRQWLLRFEFTRAGATGQAVGPPT